EAECMTLGEWYCSAALGMTGPTKSALAARSTLYLSRYLQLHGTEDAHAIKARTLLGKMQAIEKPAVRQVVDSAPSSGQAINLLKDVKIADAPAWTISKDGLRVATDSVSMFEL